MPMSRVDRILIRRTANLLHDRLIFILCHLTVVDGDLSNGPPLLSLLNDEGNGHSFVNHVATFCRISSTKGMYVRVTFNGRKRRFQGLSVRSREVCVVFVAHLIKVRRTSNGRAYSITPFMRTLRHDRLRQLFLNSLMDQAVAHPCGGCKDSRSRGHASLSTFRQRLHLPLFRRVPATSARRRSNSRSPSKGCNVRRFISNSEEWNRHPRVRRLITRDIQVGVRACQVLRPHVNSRSPGNKGDYSCSHRPNKDRIRTFTRLIPARGRRNCGDHFRGRHRGSFSDGKDSRSISCGPAMIEPIHSRFRFRSRPNNGASDRIGAGRFRPRLHYLFPRLIAYFMVSNLRSNLCGTRPRYRKRRRPVVRNDRDRLHS